MQNKHSFIYTFFLLTASATMVMLAPSCTVVKPYQKNRINDSEMSLSNRPVQRTELSFESYREGSSGANGGKNGGGCGCN